MTVDSLLGFLTTPSQLHSLCRIEW